MYNSFLCWLGTCLMSKNSFTNQNIVSIEPSKRLTFEFCIKSVCESLEASNESFLTWFDACMNLIVIVQHTNQKFMILALPLNGYCEFFFNENSTLVNVTDLAIALKDHIFLLKVFSIRHQLYQPIYRNKFFKHRQKLAVK